MADGAPAEAALRRRLVPLAGVEPARCCHHQILSLARLPVPPQGHHAILGGGDHSDARRPVNADRALTVLWVDTFAARRYAKCEKGWSNGRRNAEHRADGAG